MCLIPGGRFPLPIETSHYKKDSQLPPSSTVWVGPSTQSDIVDHAVVQAQSSTVGHMLGMIPMDM